MGTDRCKSRLKIRVPLFPQSLTKLELYLAPIHRFQSRIGNIFERQGIVSEQLIGKTALQSLDIACAVSQNWRPFLDQLLFPGLEQRVVYLPVLPLVERDKLVSLVQRSGISRQSCDVSRAN